MKDIIEQLGVKLTLAEFSQVAKMFSTDVNINIKYSELLTLLFPAQKAFDRKQWCDHTTKQLRQWFIREKLILKDAFKLIDRDGDGYISERDLSEFLLNRLQFASK